MRSVSRHICLLIDNFSGHTISYELRNIRIVFFEPNLTPFVQPLDAGVIRCLKAHYRQAFCKRAIDLDEAGEREIYKIKLLEAMIMAKMAWKEVLPLTIEHCWAHTGIQRLVSCATAFTYNWKLTRFHSQPYNPAAIPVHMNPNAWDLLRKFASSDSLTLPEVEAQLESLLRQRYVDNDWQPALKAIMDAEGDVEAATAAVEKLAGEAAQNSRLKICLRRMTVRIGQK